MINPLIDIVKKLSQNLVLKLVIIMMLCQTSAEYSHGQSKIVVGRVLDSVNLKAVPELLVINKTSGQSTITDAEGYYYIKMQIKDTLVLYLLSYLPKYFYFKNNDEFDKQAHLILVKPNIEQLKEVEILGKKQKANQYPYNTMPATLVNPISFLYERYSKKYQQYAKLKEIIDKKEQEQYLIELKNRRLSKELILAVTDIEPDELDEFINKSNFTKSFLEQSTDYELIVEIIKKYKWWSDRR